MGVAERSPLQLPESLIPEQVPIDTTRKEQRTDPFSVDLLSQLEKIPDGEVVTQADGRTKSGRALRLSKFAALDGVLFRVTEEASDPKKEGYDSARCYVPVTLRKQVIRTMHSSAFGAHRNETATRTRSWSCAAIGLEWTLNGCTWQAAVAFQRLGTFGVG